MESTDRSGLELDAVRRALERVEALRANQIPFDPTRWLAALREALAEPYGDRLDELATKIERVATAIEESWVQLVEIRGSVLKLRGELPDQGAHPADLLDATDEFVRRTYLEFTALRTVTGLIEEGRRIRSRLEQSTLPLAGPFGDASAPIDLQLSPSALPAPAARTASWVVWVRGRIPRLRSASGLTLLVVIAFAALGAYDRLAGLGDLSLWNDEAQSTLNAFSIQQHGYPVILSQHLINNWEPLYPYLEAISIAIFGESNFAFRLPSALIGIALIPISYYVGSRLRDRYVGIALAAMVAFSSEYIAWSRQARWYLLFVAIFAVAFLVAALWTRTVESRRQWLYVIAFLALGVLAALTSLGLFLLYLPGVLAAFLTYVFIVRWGAIRRFFGWPSPSDPTARRSRGRFIAYRHRPWFIVGGLVALAGLIAARPGALGAAYVAVVTRAIGYPPYPVVYSSNFGVYLAQYYPGILALAFLAIGFIVRRRSPFEFALLGFTAGAFLGVSVGASITNNIAGGNASFERHILPLIYFLFVLSAISIVELGRWIYRALVPRLGTLPRWRRVGPALFGVAVVVLLVVPGVVVPSDLTVYKRAAASQVDHVVKWFPFALVPRFPSALYSAVQPNYQLATEYVLAHRNLTDVVGATNPGASEAYRLPVEYWVRGNAVPSTEIQLEGQLAFFQTGSLLVANTSQLVHVMFQAPGWLISDTPGHLSVTFPDGMALAVSHLMTPVANGSDVSIFLYHWNRFDPVLVLQTLEAENRSLISRIGSNLSLLLNWAATMGVTASPVRDLILPFETYLLTRVSNASRPLAVLCSVFNNRPDLQQLFPDVLREPPNDTALIHWAYLVASHTLPDRAAPTLAPFVAWYRTHG
jgi:uncharacterized membrane protein